jgi:(2Fe-2S) ferredoxin/SAM-dependent methyltransferase
MEAFRYHIYICDQKKPEGIPGCSAKGSAKIIEILRKEIMSRGLANDIQVTTCGSLGLCESGPNMVVYPDGVWYSGVTSDDVPEIVREHLQAGHIVQRLVNDDAAAIRAEIDSNKMRMSEAMRARDEAGVIPDELMQAIQGFRASRVILTAIELDLFSAIKQGSTAYEVSAKLGLDPRATETLLNALVALELLEKKNGVFRNALVAARYLTDGGRDDSRTSLIHTVNLWERWSTLTECVRKGKSVTYRDPAERPDEYTEAFIAAMHKNASFRAPQVIGVLNWEHIKKVLDVGGGSGAYSIAFARTNKGIYADVFDLPNVVPLTQKYIREAGLEDRVRTIAGDMRTDDLGKGYDMVFISAICHMNSPYENIRLFQKASAALVPNGRIVMQDYILTSDKTSPASGALFAINMLVGTQSGSSYSGNEYREWLDTAGFLDIKKVALPGPTALMVARRP